MELPKKIVGFFHICTINNWREITDDLIKEIIDSGLYNDLTTLYLGVVGNEKVIIDESLSKIKVAYQHPDITNYEFKTIEYLHNFCKLNNDYEVFYIHTKGVSRVGRQEEKPIRDWRNLMKYFCISQYKLCLEELEKVDIVGVNWFQEFPWPHFSGNFWWANADYVSKLEPLLDVKVRTNAEFWIGTGQPHVSCLHQSGLLNKGSVDHYKKAYPSKNYVNNFNAYRLVCNKKTKPLSKNKLK